MYFGKNLRYLRKLKSWSQDEVADKLGYKSFTTIQKWESGDSEPPMNKLRSVCLLFNIPMDLILNCDLEINSHQILTKIRELKYDYNVNSKYITETLDIANISYDEWISGESQSYMFYLSEIANIFDVSTDFLIGKTKLFRSINDNENAAFSVPSGDETISSSEIEYIKKYRALDTHGKEMVDFTLEKEYERSKALAEQEDNNIVEMPSHLEVNAANHDKNSTPEERQAGDSIMSDDSEWE